MRKGISPLVAAVLLIAVTMTIAGVLAYWASSFVRSQTELFQNQTVATECNFGNLQVYACNYDSNSTKITMILNNIGTIDLRDLIVYVIYPDNTIKDYALNATLASRRLESYILSDVLSGFLKINVKTQCTNVYAESACK